MTDAIVAPDRPAAAAAAGHLAAPGGGPAERPDEPAGRPLRHDPARRHPARGPHPVAGRQAQDRPPARRVRVALHRGRLARAPTPRTSSSSPRPGRSTWRNGPARRLRLDPPPLNRPEARPEPAGARRRRDAGRHDLRQELAAPRDRGPGRHAGREPGHGRRLGRLRGRAPAARSSTTPSTTSTATRPTRTTPWRPCARPAQAGARTLVLCDTNGGTLTDELVDDRPATHGRPGRPIAGGAAGHLGHPHPQRRRARRGQLAGRGRGRRAPRPGHDQRLRRALRQRQPGQHPGRPGSRPSSRRCPPAAAPGRPDRAVALRGRDRQHRARTTTSRTSAGRPSPTRAASTARRRPRSSAAYQHVDPAVVGNEIAPRRVSELGGRANTQLRAEQLGQRLDGVDPRGPEPAHQAARGGRAGLRGRRGVVRAARSGATRRATRRPFRILDFTVLVEQRDGRELLRRGDGQGRGGGRGAPHRGRRQRPGQRPRQRPCARRSARSTRSSTPSTSSTTRSASSTARRPPAAQTRVIIDSSDGPRTWSHDGQRHEHHRGLGGRRWATRSSTRSGRPARELRRRDERHFTTADRGGPGRPAPAAGR